jgi:hypothetical protein
MVHIQLLFMVPNVATPILARRSIVTRRRCLSVAAALIALAGLGGLLAPSSPQAQGSCRSMCWEAYGACYKSTNNRQRCQALLQRCLNSCIRSRR